VEIRKKFSRTLGLSPKRCAQARKNKKNEAAEGA
jgi:hypothetical protein